MAAKRFFDDDNEDQPNQKRIKTTRPSFASVIREVVTVNFIENFCSALEPMLRTVVSEEVENGLKRCFMNSSTLRRHPSLKMIQQVPSATAALHLRFAVKLSLPIFTGTKIVDANLNHLQIILVDHDMIPTSLPYPIKLEIVVVDGDFPHGGDDKNVWSKLDFSTNIVKERSGKRPLLTGDLNITMRDGSCFVGDVEFTDNSSWIRSRKFRLAARVVAEQQQHQGVVIREAITEAFVVKDHRGELYKKHHPPALNDEVWRLEKIGKGGTFHQKLSSHGINTVQDFLKLYTVECSKLKKILGVGMSVKMWDATIKHAKNCVMGTKVYRYNANNYTLLLNPICRLIKAEFNGHVYYQTDFKAMQMPQIQSLVKDACANWDSLEELDGTTLLNQGEVVGNEVVVAGPSSSYASDTSLSSAISLMPDSGSGVEGDYCYNNYSSALSHQLNKYYSPPPSFYIANTNNNKCGITFFSETSSDGDIP